MCGFLFLSGCGDSKSAVLGDLKKLNKYNVAKARACLQIYASRNNQKAPKDKEQLLAFLKAGSVDRNLERIGIDKNNIEEVFISERDGKPLKIKWGGRIDPDKPLPLAFEVEGVDGIRLVAAEVVKEVDNEEEYQKLWNGDYKFGPGENDDPEL
jgi:hypothetical protein